MLAPRCAGLPEGRDQASHVLDTIIKHLSLNALRDGEGASKGCRNHHPSCRRWVSSWERRRNERGHRPAKTRASSILHFRLSHIRHIQPTMTKLSSHIPLYTQLSRKTLALPGCANLTKNSEDAGNSGGVLYYSLSRHKAPEQSTRWLTSNDHYLHSAVGYKPPRQFE
jgi:hypothetical protein